MALKIKRHLDRRIFYLLLICPLFTFSQNLSNSADVADKIEVSVTPDQANWIYQLGENVKFNVLVKGESKSEKDLRISYEIGPEKMDPLKRGTLVLNDGAGVIEGGTMTMPGFLRCEIKTKVAKKQYTALATAGFGPEKIAPTAVVPDDFEEFWKKARAEAANVPLSSQLVLLTHRSTDSVNVYHVSFQNNQPGSRIYGILCVPKKSGKYPALIRFPGAGVRGYSGNSSLASKGMITLEIGIHGIPVDLENEVYNSLLRGALFNYPFFNLESRDQYYFKRVIQGCLKSVDFIHSLPQFDGSSLAVMGSSQGGALSIITTALDSRVKYLVALCPALSDLTGYLHSRAGGWPHMFNKTNIINHGTAEKIKTSAYYDVVNFARLIKVPGFYSWGLNDQTTPPTSMYSAYNLISAPKELFIIPEGGHKIYPEQVDRYTKWISGKIINNNQ